MLYAQLVAVYERLAGTAKRLKKTYYVSEFLKQVSPEDSSALLLLQGLVFPIWDPRTIGVSTQTAVRALQLTAGVSKQKVQQVLKETGDLGTTAERLMQQSRQSTLMSYAEERRHELTVSHVISTLRRLAETEGEGTFDRKINLISELLNTASPQEARYIVRTVLEDLRVGVAEGTMRDALVWAFFAEEAGIRTDTDFTIEHRERYNELSGAIQRSYDLTNDFEEVFRLLCEKGESGLAEVSVSIGKPIKVMLAQKSDNIKDCFQRVGAPAQFEYKYDGFRIQVHKKDNEIRLFTRRLEEVTPQFPDLVRYIQEQVHGNGIFDSEAVGYDPKTHEYLPFQSISQRIKRKYNIEHMAQRFPVELNFFDVMYYNGRDLLNEPFSKRREVLQQAITESSRRIGLSLAKESSSAEEISAFFDESVQKGNEGLMAKKLDAAYKPGSRVGFMVKLKGTMEHLELVIVEAEWGEGKRANWFSSFTLACVGDDGSFLPIGKVGTGIKEKSSQGVSFEQLTELIRPHIQKEEGKRARIQPRIVVEVTYEEIQKSPTYASGFALRFPRVLFLRDDRRPEDATSLSYIQQLSEQA